MRAVAIVGPTATGKSQLGIALAEALGGEVINADAMQLYRGMDIGTAKVTAARAPRGSPPPAGRPGRHGDRVGGAYSATPARRLESLLAAGRVPVLVAAPGCTSVPCSTSWTSPARTPRSGRGWSAELSVVGAEVLHARLVELDPWPTAILPSNGRRVVRALE